MAASADLAAFAARSGIASNLARHSRGVDRNDLALLRAAYTDDATVTYGMFEGMAAEFAAFLVASMEGSAITAHRTSNMLVRVDGDRARSESYVVAYTRTLEPEGPDRQRLIGGRYLDRHERKGDRWRIAHRTYVLDWSLNNNSTEGARVGAGVSMHGEADPAHDLFAGAPCEVKEEGPTMGAIEEAVAKQALHDLVATYARGIDRGDEVLLASVFHADAIVVTGMVDGSGPDFARDMVAAVREGLQSCFHSLTNEYFEVDGDRATGETYVLARSLAKGNAPTQSLVGGRYLDRFERRDGKWRIAERRFVADWNMVQPATVENNGLYESLTMRGSWAPDDPSCAFFRD